MTTTFAYLGPEGTFTEEAAILYDSSITRIPEPSIVRVGAAVVEDPHKKGIIPIENSLEGPVTYSQDLLINNPTLLIEGEVVLPINHYLITKPSTSLEEIESIYSHPQSLGQCKNYLQAHFPEVEQIASLSNATAVTTMLADASPCAAIGPKRTAEIYNGKIVDSKIQDQDNNETRFIILGHSDHAPTGNDKTSICISFKEDRPGSLYEVLGVFAAQSINLTKIESRPTKEVLGRYHFLIDCIGHRQDEILKNCFMAIEPIVDNLTIFGSYPKYESPQ
jgi:prephenate dehydratase